MFVIGGLVACGDFPELPWVLRATPRMVSARVEVVEPGPLSAEGLLPIPADRVRSEPLPGDVVEVSALVLSRDGELTPDDLEPVWLLCPRNTCIATLRRPGALEPCGDHLPEKVACRLPSARFVAPQLDPSRSLAEQAVFRVALVGHTEEEMTTEDCLERFSDPEAPSWDGCISGYTVVRYGPRLRLYAIGLEQGLEVPDFDFDPAQLDVPVVPLFNPESVPLRMAPIYEGSVVDESRSFFASPNAVTTLEPGVTYTVLDYFDPRDAQSVLFLESGLVEEAFTVPEFHPVIDTPDILGYGQLRWVIWAPETSAQFTLYVVVSDQVGGAAWAPFDFEVREP